MATKQLKPEGITAPPKPADAAPVLGFFKIHEDAKAPVRATEGAACYDLHAVEVVSVAPGRASTIRTGLRFAVPDGYVLKVYSRSGHGFRAGVRLGNAVGVIDSDFIGELLIRLHNDSRDVFNVLSGERVAQCMLEKLVEHELVELDVFTKSTARGEGGFGSTG